MPLVLAELGISMVLWGSESQCELSPIKAWASWLTPVIPVLQTSMGYIEKLFLKKQNNTNINNHKKIKT